MNCGRCGATVEDGAFCKHCGARVLKPSDLGTDQHTAPERFDLAKAHDSYAFASAHTPRVSAKTEIAGPLAIGVFMVFFLVFSQSTMNSGTPMLFRAMFVLIPGIGLVLMLVLLRKALKFRAAPITNDLLVVVDERIAVNPGSRSSTPATTYFATLQDRNGGRVEYETYDWLAGRVAPGDIGVAYIKGDHLVDFARIAV